MAYNIKQADIDPSHIAVIGMSGAFPGAASIDEFWFNILHGKEGIVEVSEQDCLNAGIEAETLAQANYVKRAAFLTEAKGFDARFFGYSDAEAALLDPQHRLLLQHAWAALESAAYIPDQMDCMVGVYAGCGFNRYLLDKLSFDVNRFSVNDFQKMIANDKDFLCTRISHKLNLTGPSMTVQTACSTSLVAIQMGCSALQSYQTDIALCGGVTINVPHGAGYLYTQDMIFSPTGRCQPFAADADGTVFGEGVGMVALKRLEEAIADNDPIIAVVRGAAVNNDGNKKLGYTAPSADGQAEVIKLAHSLADVAPQQVAYVETHGTGTSLGDPIEISGLKTAFGKSQEKSCQLGTLKANIGHLDAAAGVASFIKAALIVKEKILPPNLHLQALHPDIDLDNSPFYLSDKAQRVQQDQVIAGVSAFGVGGTNAHILVESPPARIVADPVGGGSYCVVTAKNSEVIIKYKDKVETFAQANPQALPELAYTLYRARKPFEYRSFLSLYHDNAQNSISTTHSAAIYRAHKNPRIAFLFPGQGAEYEGMAAAYYDSVPVFREHFDRCIAIYAALSSYDLRSLLLSAEKNEDIHLTEHTQPALFILEYCLCQVLRSQHIHPTVMLGHSLGQYVAACIAGVFSLEDAMQLVLRRGQIMAASAPGSMLAVFSSQEQLLPLLPENIEFAAINSPSRVVLAGTDSAIAACEQMLAQHHIPCRRLPVGHAFHSRAMDKVLADFDKVLAKVTLAKPRQAVLPTTEKQSDLSDRHYWIEHLRDTVNFNCAAIKLTSHQIDTCIEVGPGQALSSFIKEQPALSELNTIQVLPKANLQKIKNREIKNNDCYARLLVTLWCCGCDIELESEGLISAAERIHAPTYPFCLKQYWLPSLETTTERVDRQQTSVSAQDSHANLLQTIERAWSNVFSLSVANHDDNFFDLGGDSLIGLSLAEHLAKQCKVDISVADIIRNPTISQLHAFLSPRITEKASSESFDVIFCLDKRGAELPLFLVSGAHDDVYSDTHQSNYEKDAYRYFSTLVKHLGHARPIYGFRPQGILYGEDFLSSVEEMAAQNIAYMKRVQAQGPYLIGGECVGGLVAMEMSRQLIRDGEQVKHVILMDTVYPSRLFHFQQKLLMKRRRIKRAVLKGLHLATTLQLNQLIKHNLVCTRLLLIYLFPITDKIKKSKNANFGSQKYLDILLRYQPYPFGNTIHLLANEDWAANNERLGWDKEQWENMKFIVVKGDHQTRLSTFGDKLGQTILAIMQDKG